MSDPKPWPVRFDEVWAQWACDYACRACGKTQSVYGATPDAARMVLMDGVYGGHEHSARGLCRECCERGVR